MGSGGGQGVKNKTTAEPRTARWTQENMESRTTALGHSFGRPAECLQTEARHVFARKVIRRTPDTAVVLRTVVQKVTLLGQGPLHVKKSWECVTSHTGTNNVCLQNL